MNNLSQLALGMMGRLRPLPAQGAEIVTLGR